MRKKGDKYYYDSIYPLSYHTNTSCEYNHYKYTSKKDTQNSKQ